MRKNDKILIKKQSGKNQQELVWKFWEDLKA